MKNEKLDLNVLCLEDSPMDAELLEEYLKDNSDYNINMHVVASKQEYIDALTEQYYDLILADFMLPGYDGFDALLLAKKMYPDTPYICVSGSIGEVTAVELLKQGATDYVLKDQMGRLIHSIERALTYAKEEQRLKEYQEAIRSSDATHKAMIANILDVLSIINRDGSIRYMSPNVKKWFGWNADSLKGKFIWELIFSHRSDGLKEDLIRFLDSSDSEFNCDYQMVCQDGSLKHIQMNVVNLIDNQDIRGLLVNFIDISERIRHEEEISFLSYHDYLTGLYNRIFFEAEKKRLNQKEFLPISIIMGDLNGLKLINDAFGHEEGDNLLIEIGKILRESCREQDIIARIGGDEFCILLPNTDGTETQMVCSKIYKACDNYKYYNKGKSFYPSISIGHSTKYEEEESIDVILKNAEDFMSRQKLLESKSTHSSIITYIRTSIFEKSQETEEHAERLAMMAKEIGKAIGLKDEKMDELELLATLHDIGKISIDANILTKPGKLTEDEWGIMKKHPEIGYRITMASYELMPIAFYIQCHHERWDGKGYPQGLKGDEIPLLSRIIAIVDSFDAMTNDRPYRKAMSLASAIDEIRSNSGYQFDPTLTKVFIEDVLKDSF